MVSQFQLNQNISKCFEVSENTKLITQYDFMHIKMNRKKKTRMKQDEFSP